MPGLFITGTDTEIGKTRVACAVLKSLDKQGLRVAGMKPVASGAEEVNGQRKNEDAMALMQASSLKLPYEQVNPYVFKTPASPHIAAQLENRHVEMETIASCYQQLEQQVDMVIVEGVGGWLAPLNQQQTVSDMALSLQLPVVLVVGMRIGCLNHAMLTARVIEQSGLPLAGWIANCVDKDFSYLEQNITTLEKNLKAPLIARLEFNQDTFSDLYDKSISLLARSK